jgi:putative sterol carrier protein/NAD(P)H-dependent FMN reductase
MKAALKILPIVCASAFITVGEFKAFSPLLMAGLGLGLLAGLIPVMLLLHRWGRASMVEWGMSAFVALGALGFAVWPGGLGRLIAAAPVAVLYGVLFGLVALPPLFGGPLFTEHFAKKRTPEAVRATNIYQDINRRMTLVWAALFAACSVSSLLVFVFSPPAGPVPHIVFFAFIPLALLLGLGLPFTKKYPDYYQRKMGLEPVAAQAEAQLQPSPPENAPPLPAAGPASEERNMSKQGKIVAINGSPHKGIGNTNMMIEMLRPTLEAEGFDLEVIELADQEIDYCTGCALCLEKGKCWIPDDQRGIVERLLAADGIILASPVYFFHVTAQMKTFLDRSLPWGHKPRGTWKPGLAISVAAAFSEVEVANYLAKVLGVYGAFSVGTLTGLATGPGEFMGKQWVESRARDLARDLAVAIKENRRYPASEQNLFFYLLMGWLVKSHKDGIMGHDYKHWQEKGFYDGFEAFIKQEWTEDPSNTKEAREEVRQAWIKSLIAERKAKKAGQAPPAKAATAEPPATGGAQDAKSCLELLEMMPLGFNAQAAGDLPATVQFDISGDEEFVAHLVIADGKCSFNQGPAQAPELVVKAPAQVWLDISQGRLDGQAAFMGGKYTTTGDIMLLMRFHELFPG